MSLVEQAVQPPPAPLLVPQRVTRLQDFDFYVERKLLELPLTEEYLLGEGGFGQVWHAAVCVGVTLILLLSE